MIASVICLVFIVSFLDPSLAAEPVDLVKDNTNEGLFRTLKQLSEDVIDFVRDAISLYTDDPKQQKIIIQGLLSIIGILLLWGAKLWIKNFILKWIGRVLIGVIFLGMLYFLMRFFFL